MTPEAQNIAIAEWMGWKRVEFKRDLGPNCYLEASGIPNFAGDLNAIHEAEKKLPQDDRFETYIAYMEDIMGVTDNEVNEAVTRFAPANVRAEALLRTLSLWVD